MKKNYIGIIRDHSGSMSHLSSHAMKDYNDLIASLKQNAEEFDQDTDLTVIRCADVDPSDPRGRTVNLFEVMNRRIERVTPLNSYYTPGDCTPLFDAVLDMIQTFEAMPDVKQPDVAVLIYVITDGGNNKFIKLEANNIQFYIKRCIDRGNWTFTFRVPQNHSRVLIQRGISRENILEWELSERGIKESSAKTLQATRNYFEDRAAGAVATSSFYSNLNDVKASTVKAKLVNISDKVDLYTVNQDDIAIRDFIERATGKAMLKGAAFYHLTKAERRVQDYKRICIRDKKSKEIYSGVEARNLLGIPHTGEITLRPGDHGNYDVFIQSTSTNRKLKKGTLVLYWPEIGEPMGRSRKKR